MTWTANAKHIATLLLILDASAEADNGPMILNAVLKNNIVKTSTLMVFLKTF